MKLLLDACVWGGAKKFLENLGHDVVWAGEWLEDPGDREILNQAHAECRVLVTLGKDFGQIAILEGVYHSGILRLVDISAKKQGPTFPCFPPSTVSNDFNGIYGFNELNAFSKFVEWAKP